MNQQQQQENNRNRRSRTTDLDMITRVLGNTSIRETLPEVKQEEEEEVKKTNVVHAKQVMITKGGYKGYRGKIVKFTPILVKVTVWSNEYISQTYFKEPKVNQTGVIGDMRGVITNTNTTAYTIKMAKNTITLDEDSVKKITFFHEMDGMGKLNSDIMTVAVEKARLGEIDVSSGKIESEISRFMEMLREELARNESVNGGVEVAIPERGVLQTYYIVTEGNRLQRGNYGKLVEKKENVVRMQVQTITAIPKKDIGRTEGREGKYYIKSGQFVGQVVSGEEVNDVNNTIRERVEVEITALNKKLDFTKDELMYIDFEIMKDGRDKIAEVVRVEKDGFVVKAPGVKRVFKIDRSDILKQNYIENSKEEVQENMEDGDVFNFVNGLEEEQVATYADGERTEVETRKFTTVEQKNNLNRTEMLKILNVNEEHVNMAAFVDTSMRIIEELQKTVDMKNREVKMIYTCVFWYLLVKSTATMRINYTLEGMIEKLVEKRYIVANDLWKESAGWMNKWLGGGLKVFREMRMEEVMRIPAGVRTNTVAKVAVENCMRYLEDNNYLTGKTVRMTNAANTIWKTLKPVGVMNDSEYVLRKTDGALAIYGKEAKEKTDTSKFVLYKNFKNDPRENVTITWSPEQLEIIGVVKEELQRQRDGGVYKEEEKGDIQYLIDNIYNINQIKVSKSKPVLNNALMKLKERLYKEFDDKLEERRAKKDMKEAEKELLQLRQRELHKGKPNTNTYVASSSSSGVMKRVRDEMEKEKESRMKMADDLYNETEDFPESDEMEMMTERFERLFGEEETNEMVDDE